MLDLREKKDNSSYAAHLPLFVTCLTEFLTSVPFNLQLFFSATGGQVKKV